MNLLYPWFAKYLETFYSTNILGDVVIKFHVRYKLLSAIVKNSGLLPNNTGVVKKHDKQKILKGIGLKSIEKLMSKNIRTIVDVLEHRGNEECETLLKMNKLLS